MIERLISFAILLQTIELFFIEPWPWSIVGRELPKFLKLYRAIFALRLLAAIATLIHPHAAGLALELLTTCFVAWRWRGTFNGGSDCMTVQILLATLVASLIPAWYIPCLIYIGIQISLSYLVAGLAKLRSPEWRAGRALPKFLKRGEKPMLSLSWLAITFECLFPLGLIHPTLALVFMFNGIAFHLINFYFFGLNRFFFVWLAGYPAVFLTSLYFVRS